ncbi:MAG: TetR/AcrR family transcriptional regulator [Bdellovibrio sp.]|nr:TetR/AcrR family transcriptional regulator [Bdellovibrio sp.]
MLKPSAKVASRIRTREKLIKAAKNLFAERGYDGTSVKEIAKAAKVNISLISYHFDGKEGLYCECLSTIGNTRVRRTERILTHPASVEEFRVRLHLFVEEIFIAHLEEPEVSKIILRECELQMPFTKEVFRATFLKIYQNLVEFFNYGKDQGWIRNEIDIEAAMGLFLGGIIHCAQKDWMNEMFFGRTMKDQKYREKLIANAVTLCLDGCMTLPKPASRSSL